MVGFHRWRTPLYGKLIRLVPDVISHRIIERSHVEADRQPELESLRARVPPHLVAYFHVQSADGGLANEHPSPARLPSPVRLFFRLVLPVKLLTDLAASQTTPPASGKVEYGRKGGVQERVHFPWRVPIIVSVRTTTGLPSEEELLLQKWRRSDYPCASRSLMGDAEGSARVALWC